MRNTSRFRATGTRWTVVVHELPLRLGWIVRLEDGPLYRGPASWLGLSWWWRPTKKAAVLKGFREVTTTGKVLG